MPAPNATANIQEVPLPIVGGTKFGRYPKISSEATWNFIVSDGFLVPYAGYKNILTLNQTKPGRGIWSSSINQAVYAVIGAVAYRIVVDSITGNLVIDPMNPNGIGQLLTDVGDVYIAENNGNQICFTDGSNVYVYNYATEVFLTSIPSGSPTSTQFPFPFPNPGYVSFQNTHIIIASTTTTNWVLSAPNDATVWSNSAQTVGSLQTKPDYCQAAVPMPGLGNNILIFGRNVIESWQDVGAALFPYQKNVSFNIDYGCLNAATIAHLKNYVVWLGVNEQSGPVLMAFYGNDFQAITTDGIDYQLSNLTNPENCTGFLYQQDGHVIYQFTFPDDNISYAYDFETKLFFNVSDENLNYHIAREVVYFNNTYYFVSLRHGNLFEFDTLFTAAQYSNSPPDLKSIPRIRICPPLRLPSQRYYIAKSLGFTVENGQPNKFTTITSSLPSGTTIAAENQFNIACENGDSLITESVTPEATYVYASEQINLAVSRDGGETFGTFWSMDMNPTGKFMSRFIFQRLGHANDSTYQLRFNGFGRFVVTDGVVSIYE